MAGTDIFPDGHPEDLYKRYANRIFNCSAIGANAIRKARGGAVPDDTWVSILFEFVFFYAALTATTGLVESDNERRERVIAKLSRLVIPHAVDYLLEDTDEDGNEKTKDQLLEEGTKRSKDYEKCEQFLPDVGEAPKSTALDAFCHRVAKLAGEPGDAAIMVTCHAHIRDSLDLLDMDLFAAMA